MLIRYLQRRCSDGLLYARLFLYDRLLYNYVCGKTAVRYNACDSSVPDWKQILVSPHIFVRVLFITTIYRLLAMNNDDGSKSDHD